MLLVLLRHGESAWNLENRFTGWTDVDLSPDGEREADAAGRLLRAEGLDFDVCYTSYLKRAIRTLHRALAQMDREWLPVYKTWKLNERHYGALQGLNKAETAAKFGEEQVRLWRRAFDVRPPALEDGDERCPQALPPTARCRRSSCPGPRAWRTPSQERCPTSARRSRPRSRRASACSSRRTATPCAPWSCTWRASRPRRSPGSTCRRAFPSSTSCGRTSPSAVQAKMNAVANQGKAQPGPAPARPRP